MSMKILPFDDLQIFAKSISDPIKYSHIINKNKNIKWKCDVTLENVSSDLWKISKEIRENDKFCKYYDHLEELTDDGACLDYIDKNINVEDNDIFIGGSHVISHSLISKFLNKWPNGNIIIFDAHLDFMVHLDSFGRGNWLKSLLKRRDVFHRVIHIGSNLKVNNLKKYMYLKNRSATIFPIKKNRLVTLDPYMPSATKEDIKKIKNSLKKNPCYLSIDIDAFKNTFGLWPHGHLDISFLSDFIEGIDIKMCDIVEISSFKGKKEIFQIIDIMKKYFKNKI